MFASLNLIDFSLAKIYSTLSQADSLCSTILYQLKIIMVEDNTKKEGPVIQFVESIDKETEASLAAFLEKVSTGLTAGDAGDGLPVDGLNA